VPHPSGCIPPVATAPSSAVFRAALSAANAGPWTVLGIRTVRSARSNTFLHPVAEAADEITGERERQDRPRGLNAHTGILDPERGGGDQPRRAAAGERRSPTDQTGHPGADQQCVGGVARAHDVLGVEGLDGQRGRDEQQRADRRGDVTPQDAVAALEAKAVERARLLACRPRARRAAGAHCTHRGRDRHEARGVDKQRAPAPQAPRPTPARPQSRRNVPLRRHRWPRTPAASRRRPGSGRTRPAGRTRCLPSAATRARGSLPGRC
jgi:hypothetical protein